MMTGGGVLVVDEAHDVPGPMINPVPGARVSLS